MGKLRGVYRPIGAFSAPTENTMPEPRTEKLIPIGDVRVFPLTPCRQPAQAGWGDDNPPVRQVVWTLLANGDSVVHQLPPVDPLTDPYGAIPHRGYRKTGEGVVLDPPAGDVLLIPVPERSSRWYRDADRRGARTRRSRR